MCCENGISGFQWPSGRNAMGSYLQSRPATKVLRVATLTAFVAIFALGCMTAGAATTAPKRIADKGTITYCMDISFPPLESYDPQTNKPVGFDVDLGAALASEMGVKSDFKNITFDGLIPAIQAGQCDAIISGLFDKPKRREVLDFVDYA